MNKKIDEEIKQEIKDFNKDVKKMTEINFNEKIKLINDLKNGLGDEIKKIGSKPTIIKRSFMQKFINTITKMF